MIALTGAAAGIGLLSVPADAFTASQKLTAPDGAAGDFFGQSVALSGNTALVGAYGDDDQGGASGSAYLYDVTTGNLLQKLTAPDGAAGDYFGWSVALSGNTALVGAFRDDDQGSTSGSAYLYDVTTGNLLQKLVAPDGVVGDSFGWSVALSGNTALVGARFDDDQGSNSGSAYLFDVTTGNLLQKLIAPDGAAGNVFGYSVALSGNTALVGARFDDDQGSNRLSFSSGKILVVKAETQVCATFEALVADQSGPD